jgi:hypothetical protein
MADDKSSGGWGSGFIVLAFAAVSALYVAHQKPPLVSTRPTNIEAHLDDLRGLRQDIDARLWQDPFGAVERDAGNIHRRDRLGNSGGHATLGFAYPAKETLVLGVTLPGAPYPEVEETRRRLRYAVLSALHVAGYTPTDEKHIGYWRPGDTAPQAPTLQSQAAVGDDRPPPTKLRERVTRFGAGRRLELRVAADPAQKAADGSPQNKMPLPAFVPWEEFDRADHADHYHVLVLWLDEDVLAAGRMPIRSLIELRMRLGAFAKSEFALLGPEDSTMLAAMASEAGSDQSLDFNVPVYNFGATAEDQLVFQRIGLTSSSIADQLKQAGITHYYRTINTDDELAQSLACELMRRDPDLHLPTDRCKASAFPAGSGTRDHVVLISDWDTVYGDDLPKSVAEAFRLEEPSSATGPNCVVQMSYMRGLDGQHPAHKYSQRPKTAESGSEQNPDDESSENAEPAVATPETASHFESAQGPSQFDYLRRLANELKQCDAEFRRTDGGHIAAIGVLGSDVYDKLLILQALRPEFLEALFFTTDLDALLLPQSKARYTSGLIVASSFGLQASRELQADIPPFRSTYQTSIFRATRLAIENWRWDGTHRNTDPAETEINKPVALSSWAPTPMLFQIGRTVPRSLPSDSGVPSSAASTDGGAPRASADHHVVALLSAAQPAPDQLFPKLPGGAYRGASLGCAALLLAALFSFRSVRSLCFPPVAPDRASVLATTDKATAPAVQPRYGLIVAIALVTFGASFYFWWTWPCIADWLTENGNGEPMALFEGISLWPTILLRSLGIGLTFWLICYTRHSLVNNKTETDNELGIAASPASFFGEWRRIRSDVKSYPTPTAQIKALLWFDRPPSGPGECREGKFEEIVGSFAVGWLARCIRAGIGTAAMFALWQVLDPIFGEPYAPARGRLVVAIFSKVTIIEVVLTLFLIFLVADAALFSRMFIKRLTAIKTQWPRETVQKFTAQFNLVGGDLADWIDMHCIAMRTRCITPLIYLPFIALAVLVISRSPLFDNFTTPWTLVITQALSAAVVIGSFVSLRAAAEQARTVAHDDLTGKIIAAKAHANSRGRAAQLERLLAEIDGLNDGAFAPWSSQPLVKAVLLPLLTYGGTMLLHFYALPGN